MFGRAEYSSVFSQVSPLTANVPLPVCSVPTSSTVPDEPCNSFLMSLPPSCSVRYYLQEQDVALFRARTLNFFNTDNHHSLRCLLLGQDQVRLLQL